MNKESWNTFYLDHKNGGPWDISRGPDDHVVEFIDSLPNEKLDVLDSGCADGRNLKYILTKGHNVTGLDISKEVTERTQKRFPDATIIHGDIIEQYLNRAFHVIIDAGAMHVNEPIRHRTMLMSYYSALRHGGRMFIRVFNSPYIQKIFEINSNYDMPVYGMSQKEFGVLCEGLFTIDRVTHDPNYGAHEHGCNYYWLSKK
jgi:SAM-dependent methyltransferase